MGILRVTIWVIRAINLPTKSPNPPSTGLSRQSVNLRNFHMRSIETRESAIRSKIGTSFTHVFSYEKAFSRGSTAPQPPQPQPKKHAVCPLLGRTQIWTGLRVRALGTSHSGTQIMVLKIAVALASLGLGLLGLQLLKWFVVCAMPLEGSLGFASIAP